MRTEVFPNLSFQDSLKFSFFYCFFYVFVFNSSSNNSVIKIAIALILWFNEKINGVSISMLSLVSCVNNFLHIESKKRKKFSI